MRALVLGALAAAAGAVVLFVWGMAAWMALPLHANTMRSLPDENAWRQRFAASGLASGAYALPGLPAESASASTAGNANQAWNEMLKRHREGPIVFLMFRSAGGEAMGPAVMAGGFAINLLACGLAAVFLSVAARAGLGYPARVGLATLLGVFAAVVSYGNLWNWMWFAPSYVLPMAADITLGWLLAGAVMAAIVRPPAKPAENAGR